MVNYYIYHILFKMYGNQQEFELTTTFESLFSILWSLCHSSEVFQVCIKDAFPDEFVWKLGEKFVAKLERGVHLRPREEPNEQ